jgi:hypothetical protein
VCENKAYIRFSRDNCVEVMCMKDIDQALAEKPKRAETYKTTDAYGDEIECFVKFPGVTVQQMKDLHEGEALNYMQGPLMPYTAVVDPHSLEDLVGIKRGEASTAQSFIKVISGHVRALKKKYGPGIDRKLWDFVRQGQVEIDLLLGEEKISDALRLLREMEKRSARQPEVLVRKVNASRESVLADAGERLDALEKLLAGGQSSKARRELKELAELLSGTPLGERAASLRATTSTKKK